MHETGKNRLHITPGPLSSGEGVIHAFRDESDTLKDDGTPVDPGVVDKRLLVVDGEFGSAFEVMKREGNTLSAIVRTAWDGGSIEPLTKTSRIRVTKPHLCYVGHITGEELVTRMDRKESWNGFSNRILWVMARRSQRVPFPAVLDGNKVSELGTRIATAIKKARESGYVPLAPDARDVWMDAYPKLTEERGGAYGAATSRAEAQVLRLALIYALLDDGHNDKVMIRAAHLNAALATWSYCEASAKYLFERPEDDQLVKRVIEALKQRPMSQSELAGVLKIDKKKRLDALRDVLDRLQGAGRIKSDEQPTPGRPKTVWRLV